MPDVLVKGGDWPEDKIIGADVVKGTGGEVISIPFVTGYSTTDLIEKLREL
jgi:bifunctional ADP-heptose synthase (sugar kinase/adenylyltransferase)